MDKKDIILAMLNEYKATGKLSVEKYEILLKLLEGLPSYNHDDVLKIVLSGGAEDA